MKRLLLIAAALLASLAFGAVVTPGAWDLYGGTKKLSSHESEAACIAAADAKADGKRYTCRTITSVVADKPPPVAVGCGPDIGGWTIPVPTAYDPATPLRDMRQTGSRLHYISTSGDDSTGELYFWNGTAITDATGSVTDAAGLPYGADPLNPSAAVKAFRRWSHVAPRRDATKDIGTYAASQIGSVWASARAGFPDWWLFKRGETFDLEQDLKSYAQERDATVTAAPQGSLSVSGGRSATERQVVGAYGDLCTARPRFVHPTFGFVTRWAPRSGPAFKHVAYLSLHFDHHDRSAGSADPVGVTFLGLPAASVDILLEDVWVDGAMVNIGPATNAAQITLRRVLLTDAFVTNGGKVQGLFFDGARDSVLRIEESILLRNGFAGGDPRSVWPPAGAQAWNIYNRNLYVSGETSSMRSGMFDSVSMVGASGDQFRNGLQLERNFFLQGYVTMGAHGGYPDADGPTGAILDNVLQRFVGVGTADNRGQPGWGLSLVSGAYGVEVARNVVMGAAGVGAAFDIGSTSWACYSHVFAQPTRGNRVHGNVFEAGTSAAVRVVDGVLGEETPGCAGWRFPGVTGNSVSDNTLLAGREWLYEPVVGAVGTKNDTTFERNRLFKTRADAGVQERTLRTYLESLGVAVKTDGFDEYFARATQQRRGQWRPEWTARPLLNHVRGGYGMPALP